MKNVSSTGDSLPQIDPKFFMLEWDGLLDVVLARLMRKAFQSQLFKDITTAETMPGKTKLPDSASDADWLQYLRSACKSLWWPVFQGALELG